MSSRFPKKVSESAVNDAPYILFDIDLNHRGTAFGGTVMSQADKIAAIAAVRHSELDCVTLYVDSFKFVGPAVKGEMLIFKAAVNRVWNTSMEVGVKVLAINPILGPRTRHVVSAYFTFVALGPDNRPTAIPQVIPETDDERRRFEKANLRRQRRLKEDQEDNSTKKQP